MDADAYPTLGGLVCKWIEDNLCFGPGDLLGEPAVLDNEKRGFIWRMYELFPLGHPLEGRRRFKRVALSLQKGSAKSELAAWLAAAELHPDAPVRFREWNKDGTPVGQGVTDPYIPLCAYTEEQTEELAYGALRQILLRCKAGSAFDIGYARITRLSGDGKAEAVTGSPNRVDGLRTTFQHFDETHRFVLDHLKRAHRVMLQNASKRAIADPWSLETTTAYAPGEDSVAEDTMEYARQVGDGTIKDSRLFFFHRQADAKLDLAKDEDRRKAVIEAAGPSASWKDIDSILAEWQDPKTDKSYWERVWTNRLVQQTRQAFDVERWRKLTKRQEIASGEYITIGFDGSRYNDATAIVATHVDGGYQWLAGLWERPYNAGPDWQVPESDVRRAMSDLFDRYTVWRCYADPPYWESTVAAWAGEYGEERVIEWRTNRWKAMAEAVAAFYNAIQDGSLSHDGDARFQSHIGSACKLVLNLWDDQHKERLWVIQKERGDSPHKMDAAVAAVLSWQARMDAVAAGISGSGRSVYETRGVLLI